MNMTAVFYIDTDKILRKGVPALMLNMIKAGHEIGMSLGASVKINDLSEDGLRGAIAKQALNFYNATTRRPLLLHVPGDTNPEKISFLTTAGYLIMTAGLDLSMAPPGKCEATLAEGISLISSSSSSAIVSMKDADSGCTISETRNIIKSMKDAGFALVSMRECIGLQSFYKAPPGDPVTFTLPVPFSVETVQSPPPQPLDQLSQSQPPLSMASNSMPPKNPIALAIAITALALLSLMI